MADFMIHFSLCNVFISVIIGFLLLAKHLFQKQLSCRMQYHLGFLLLALLIVPFLPAQIVSPVLSLSSWSRIFSKISSSNVSAVNGNSATFAFTTTNWMNDFALSVSRKTSTLTDSILSGIWITGMLAMLLFLLHSARHFAKLKKSALPLQHPEIRQLYKRCLKETNITRKIPVYSTAFLQSPVIAGIFKPCIYLPLHAISDYNETQMRYMLLHELQHYRHKDTFANAILNIVTVFYWFHPLVWYALKEMRNDRETACDIAVLNMLNETEYEQYGMTLINFAEKVSQLSFPYATGIIDNKKQLSRRIRNIVSYQKPNIMKQLRGIIAFVLIAAFMVAFSPVLLALASDNCYYHWNTADKNISNIDLSDYFGKSNGCFVLYDQKENAWNIYNKNHALKRVSPDSTYKIYAALWGLEEQVITPANSQLTWNQKTYPFTAWNCNQNLTSAMQSSVNWYFQTIDKKIGLEMISDYIHQMKYGNEEISGDLSSYWMESSLKISPVEQVELLQKLYHYNLTFAPEYIDVVKKAMCLSSYENGTLYGKTGTGAVNGQNINGWFVGYLETSDNTYFFATNICDDKDATGSLASSITLEVLKEQYHLAP